MPAWQYLQGVPAELHGVVSGHATAVLEAQELPQALTGIQWTEGRLRAFGRNVKAPVEPGQELLQDSLGLLKGGRSCQPEFGDQPVLESSGGTLHTSLCLGREGEYQLYSQFLHGPAELGGSTGGLVFRAVLEYGVAVGVQGEGEAAPLHQALQQPEISEAVLLLAEESVDHDAGGVVHGEEQRELGSALAQPAVMSAVQLDQHSFPGHSFTAYQLLWRTPSPRALQPCVDQDAPQGGPADMDALAFAEQLIEMSMAGSLAYRSSQMHHPALVRFGDSVDRLCPRRPWAKVVAPFSGKPSACAWYGAGICP